MTSRRSGVGSVIVCCVVLLASFVGLPAAVANPACVDAGVVNRFAGEIAYQAGGSVYGAKGQLIDRNVFLCGTNQAHTSAASAWVMLAGGGQYDYAQIGYAREAQMNNEKTFTEWSLSATNWSRTYHNGIFSPGDTKSYVVEYSFTDGKVRMFKSGGSDLLDWSPSVDGKWGTGWEGQFMGETWDGSDNVPGTPSNRASFTHVRVLPCRGCAYALPSAWISGSDLGVYKFAWTNEPGAFDIWTNRG